MRVQVSPPPIWQHDQFLYPNVQTRALRNCLWLIAFHVCAGGGFPPPYEVEGGLGEGGTQILKVNGNHCREQYLPSHNRFSNGTPARSSKVIMLTIMYVQPGTQAEFKETTDKRALQSVLENTGRAWSVQLLYPKIWAGKIDLHHFFSARPRIPHPTPVNTTPPLVSTLDEGPERCFVATPFDFGGVGLHFADGAFGRGGNGKGETMEERNQRHESITKVFMQPAFWGAVLGENILVAQSDAVMCRPGLDAFVKLKHDYIGAPWQRLVHSSIRVGNGGFSFRRRSKMIKSLRSCENVKILVKKNRKKLP